MHSGYKDWKTDLFKMSGLCFVKITNWSMHTKEACKHIHPIYVLIHSVIADRHPCDKGLAKSNLYLFVVIYYTNSSFF